MRSTGSVGCSGSASAWRRDFPGRALSMAWIELGDALVNVTSPGDGMAGPKSTGNVGHRTKVYVDDVDAHFERAREVGATILSKPQDGFWGGRIYRAADLEGHLWEFSQARVDLDASQWRPPSGIDRGAP